MVTDFSDVEESTTRLAPFLIAKQLAMLLLKTYHPEVLASQGK